MNVGGNSNNSENAGGFTLNSNNSSTNTNQNIGSHVCLKTYLFLCHGDLGSCQNTKQYLTQVGRETEHLEVK